MKSSVIKNTDRKKAIAETITIKVPEAEELVPMLCYEDIKQTSVENGCGFLIFHLEN